MSYWATAAVELDFASDAVSGFPAYTVPAVPLGLNADPGAAAALPGLGPPTVHVLVGAPLCPVVGFCVGFSKLLSANAAPVVKSKVLIAREAMTRFISLTPVQDGVAHRGLKEDRKLGTHAKSGQITSKSDFDT